MRITQKNRQKIGARRAGLALYNLWPSAAAAAECSGPPARPVSGRPRQLTVPRLTEIRTAQSVMTAALSSEAFLDLDLFVPTDSAITVRTRPEAKTRLWLLPWARPERQARSPDFDQQRRRPLQ